MKFYTLKFKKQACELLPMYGNSPSKCAVALDVPLKTFEKWIQAYKNNPNTFDEEELSIREENENLKTKIKYMGDVIALLKKNFA